MFWYVLTLLLTFLTFFSAFWLPGICSDILSGISSSILCGTCSSPGMPSCLQSLRSAASGAGDMAQTNWHILTPTVTMSRKRSTPAAKEKKWEEEREEKEELHHCWNLENLTLQAGNKHLCSPRPSLGQLISNDLPPNNPDSIAYQNISKRIMTSIISIWNLSKSVFSHPLFLPNTNP